MVGRCGLTWESRQDSGILEKDHHHSVGGDGSLCGLRHHEIAAEQHVTRATDASGLIYDEIR